MTIDEIKIQAQPAWEETKKQIPAELMYRAGEDVLHFIFLYAWQYGELSGYQRGHLEMSVKVDNL